MSSDKKQLSLFSKLESITISDAPSQGSTRSAVIGQTRTKNPASIRARELVQQRKRDLVAYKGGKCERCGVEYHPNVFDFHHYDPSQKSFGVCQANFQRSWQNLIAEVDKCFMLCANCHREVHTFNDPYFNKI